MFGGLKIAIILIILSVAGGGVVYVKGLQADLKVSEANNIVLQGIKEDQDAVIKQMKADFEAINKAKADLEIALANAEKDNKELNRAVRHVNRCIELASGSLVVADDFYNRQCRELVKEKMAKAGIPYDVPKEETVE